MLTEPLSSLNLIVRSDLAAYISTEDEIQRRPFEYNDRLFYDHPIPVARKYSI